jgi:APA family basic amino acid/polyamine antiporter
MEEVKLKRTLSLLSATMIGLGGAMGAGLFVLVGEAAGMAGSGVVLSFIISAFFALFTALNYSELAASIPTTGGGYTFVRYAIGKFPAFLTGWFVWFGYMFYCALCALGFAYAVQYFIPGVNTAIVAVLIALTFMIINIRGTKETGAIQNLLTTALIIMLVIFVVSGFIHGFRPDAFKSWTPKGVIPIFTTVSYIYVCYMGFEIITTLSGEIRKPEKNIVRSMVLAFTISTLVYCVVTFVSVGVVHWDLLGESPTPLSLVALETMGSVGGTVMSAAAILAILTSLNAATGAAARIAYALSRDGYLPSALSIVHKRFNTPYIAIILSSILILIFAASGIVDFLNYASIFGFLLGDAFVNYSVIWLRKRRPTLNRPFKVPLYPYTPLLGTLSSLIVLSTVHYQAIGVGLIWAIIGLSAYYVSMLGYLRLRVAFGGITVVTGFVVLAATLLMWYGFISPFVPLSAPLLLGMLFIGILQIIVGFLNITS